MPSPLLNVFNPSTELVSSSSSKTTVEDFDADGAPPSLAASFNGPYGQLTRPLTHREESLLAHLDRLKFFLATAPSRGSTGPVMGATAPALNRFALPNHEYVSCVLWEGLYYITGTDIVRALVFRFEAFGRPVRNMKKFEEGVFSDLRNLKPGVDACLEEPKVITFDTCIYVAHIAYVMCTVTILGFAFQVSMHSYSKETEGFLLVSRLVNVTS
jgi:hypothetical protein